MYKGNQRAEAPTGQRSIYPLALVHTSDELLVHTSDAL